ncbi:MULTISPECIES: tetratricopeptide repeat protein [Spirulina sp. CCY15215]|uniref:tetratricopeptide repeat protein n=1 Tax=Spirulina sp. CCY15215 TaxID=2767591 RepID=UPI00194F92DB|nr:tetratricopeptide repeat protein [Spirulina major]
MNRNNASSKQLSLINYSLLPTPYSLSSHDSLLPIRAAFLGNMANVLRNQEPDEALALANQCLALSRELQHTSMLARTLVLIGDIHNNLNQPEEAIAYHREGLD